VTLWCWALLLGALMITSAADIVADRRRLALLATAAAFAAVPAWRMTPELILFSGVVVITLLVMSAWASGAPGIVLAQRTVGAYLRAAWTGGLHIIVGAAPLLAAEARARSDLRNTYRRPLGAALRGLALSIPIVFVLGALLIKADAAFESLVGRLFQWDAGTVASHVALTGAFTWLAAAYFCASLRWGHAETASAPNVRLGAIEGSMVLGVMNLLFLSFILVQLRYLFGGTAHVLETSGLTYAEYARRGFFELVTVTALTVPLLIALTSGVRLDSPREARIHRALSAALVVLLLALVMSALGRMRLYQAEYGWTLPRVNASALILWIAGSLVWFAATVLRGRAQRFAFGSLVGGFAMFGTLVIANPASLVVRANAERVARGFDFDAEHAASLGPDALPSLLEVLPKVASQMDIAERCFVQRQIDAATAQKGEWDPDWRQWNLARVRAIRAVRQLGPDASRWLGEAPCVAHEAELERARASRAR